MSDIIKFIIYFRHIRHQYYLENNMRMSLDPYICCNNIFPITNKHSMSLFSNHLSNYIQNLLVNQYNYCFYFSLEMKFIFETHHQVTSW